MIELHIYHTFIAFSLIIFMSFKSSSFLIKSVVSTVFCTSNSFSIWCQGPSSEVSGEIFLVWQWWNDTECVCYIEISFPTSPKAELGKTVHCVSPELSWLLPSRDSTFWGQCHLQGFHLWPNFLLKYLASQHAEKDKYSLELPQ